MRRCGEVPDVADRAHRLTASVNAAAPAPVFGDMIIFDLNCAHGHRFEGWFDSADEFDRQRGAALIVCPVCDDAHVDRLPSAQVHIPRAAARDNAPAPRPDEAEERPQHGDVMSLPPEALAKLREIVRATENVGRRFPDEARKIHYKEAPPRAIRGQASPDEAEALSDEGIDFAHLPPFLTRDTH